MRRITRTLLALVLAVGIVVGLGGCTIRTGYSGSYGYYGNGYGCDLSPLIWSSSLGHYGGRHHGGRHQSGSHHGGGHRRGR